MKVSKRRFCPVVTREISPAECGENRMSRYACPESCPFNPFSVANCDRAVELHDQLGSKVVARLLDESSNPAALARALDRAATDEEKSEAQARLFWELYYERRGGLTFAERWRDRGFEGLRNDDKVMFQANTATRVAFMEVRRIVNEQLVEVVDLLAPESASFVILSRGFAARAVRFGNLLGWIEPLPFYSILSDAITPFGATSVGDPVEILLEIVRHLGGPGADLQTWLARNFTRLIKALKAVNEDRRERLLQKVDLNVGRIEYELKVSVGDCLSALDALPGTIHCDVSDEESNQGILHARAWTDGKERILVDASQNPSLLLGRALFARETCCLHMLGPENSGDFRLQFERCLGDRVHCISEERRDLAAELKQADRPFDRSLVPPEIFKIMPRIGRTFFQMESSGEEFSRDAAARLTEEKAILNEPTPLLNGRTLREAATDPQLRPIVIRIVKARVQLWDRENLRLGRVDDINPVFRDLGIDEAMVDPPPLRAPVDDQSENEEEETFDHLPVAPKIAVPFEPDEVEERLEQAVGMFNSISEAAASLEASGATILEDLKASAAELLDPDELAVLSSWVMYGWFVLVPAGFRAPVVRIERVMDSVHAALEKRPAPDDNFIEKTLTSLRQRHLIEALTALFLESVSKAKLFKNRSTQKVVAIFLLAFTIDELDRMLAE